MKFFKRWETPSYRPKSWTELGRFVCRSAILHMLGRISSFSNDGFVRCIFCHYVLEEHRNKLRKVIEMLSDHGSFVDINKCIELLRGDAEVENNYFHISIDDGLRNTYENAASVLDDMNIPATFFIPSEVVGCGKKERIYYSKEVMNYKRTFDFMDWKSVKKLSERGFDIGAHTQHHKRLSNLIRKNKIREIKKSKEKIEDKIGKECSVISWPYGKLRDVDSEDVKIFEKVGYRAAFGGFRGKITPGKTNPYKVPRHHFEVDWPLSHIRAFASGCLE